MSFVEFIGFIISLVAMIFLVTKRFMEERKRRLNPEEYARKEEEQEANLRRFLKSINVDSEDEEEFSPPPHPKNRYSQVPPPAPHQPLIRLRETQKQPPVPPKKTSGFNAGNYGSETACDKKRNLAAAQTSHVLHHDLKPADSYEVIRIETVSPAISLLNSLKSSKDMLIIKEIFDKPLSMREPQDNKW